MSRNINKLRPGAAVNLWQPNYYEHVIRDERGLEEIRQYIVDNPLMWHEDAENPAGTGTDRFDEFLVRVERQFARPEAEGDAGVAPTEEH